MLDQGHDQAAGLRRMAPAPRLNLMAFPVAMGGDEAWIAHLAHTLRAMGGRPVVLDATRGAVAQALGLKPRHELLDLLQGARDFDGVAQHTADGVYLLRAERGVEAFVASGAPASSLFAGFARLSHNFDAVLLAMPAAELACLAAPASGAVPVLAVEPGEAGLLRAYRTVKQLSGGFGFNRFAAVGCGPRCEAPGRLQAAARLFLDVDVSMAGWMADGASPGARERLAQSLLDSAATPLTLH